MNHFTLGQYDGVMTGTSALPNENIDLSQIKWVELVSHARIKVRNAQFVNLVLGADGAGGTWDTQVLKLETTSGKECYVPLRHIVRFDLSDD